MGQYYILVNFFSLLCDHQITEVYRLNSILSHSLRWNCCVRVYNYGAGVDMLTGSGLWCNKGAV